MSSEISRVPYRSLEQGVALAQMPQHQQKKAESPKAEIPEDVATTVASFVVDRNDLLSLARVRKCFKDPCMFEYCVRLAPRMMVLTGTPEQRMELLAKRKELLHQMNAADLIRQFTGTLHFEQGVQWGSLRTNIRMLPFIPVARPHFADLVHVLEDNYQLFIGNPQDLRERVIVLNHNPLGVIRTVENGRKNLKYINALADGIHATWINLTSDERIVQFIPDKQNPQLKQLAERMEAHYRSFGGNPETLMNGPVKDTAYFRRLADAIQAIPLPKHGSCCYDCRTNFEEGTKQSFDCMCLTAVCTPAPAWAIPIGLGAGGCSGPCIGIGAGVAACAQLVSCLYFCCGGLEKTTQKEKDA